MKPLPSAKPQPKAQSRKSTSQPSATASTPDLPPSASTLPVSSQTAAQVNSTTDNIGARRLQTMMELLLQDVLFEAPEGAQGKIEFDEKAVRTKLEDYVANLERAKMMI